MQLSGRQRQDHKWLLFQQIGQRIDIPSKFFVPLPVNHLLLSGIKQKRLQQHVEQDMRHRLPRIFVLDMCRRTGHSRSLLNRCPTTQRLVGNILQGALIQLFKHLGKCFVFHLRFLRFPISLIH